MNDDWPTKRHCTEETAELFFPPQRKQGLDAKRLCLACPVQIHCLEHALAMGSNPDGIWGGTSQEERRLIRRARRKAAA